MKYGLLLYFLRFLVNVKRALWWTGRVLFSIVSKTFRRLWRLGSLTIYKIDSLEKKAVNGKENLLHWVVKRGILQIIFVIFAGGFLLPFSKFYTPQSFLLPGQDTLAYSLFGSEDEIGNFEEIVAESAAATTDIPSYRAGTVAAIPQFGSDQLARDQEVSGVVIGGSTVMGPVIIPGGVAVPASNRRTEPVVYLVAAGDTIGTIADRFGVSVPTILWENNLTARSVLKLGMRLVIPPTTGVMYTVVRGDTLQRIANNYRAKIEDIVQFNNLRDDGKGLRVGDRIMIPNAARQVNAVTSARTPPRNAQVTQSGIRPAVVPPDSNANAFASGFIWPTAARTITQYYSWTHHAVDIAGAWQTPIYAARDGVVEKAQCGWNSGYGCYIVINHGGGIKTLYGHNSQLLVSPGDEVYRGQTISLMGNTGNVRGVTGIHLHFEVQINGARLNPLSYVRPR